MAVQLLLILLLILLLLQLFLQLYIVYLAAAAVGTGAVLSITQCSYTQSECVVFLRTLHHCSFYHQSKCAENTHR